VKKLTIRSADAEPETISIAPGGSLSAQPSGA
jgi:hypothetical protein